MWCDEEYGYVFVWLCCVVGIVDVFVDLNFMKNSVVLGVDGFYDKVYCDFVCYVFVFNYGKGMVWLVYGMCLFLLW